MPDPTGNLSPLDAAQLLAFLKPQINKLTPLLDHKFRRLPYSFPLARTATINAGLTNQPLASQDFQNSLDWDFELHRVKFSQDTAHTFRDWRIRIQDNLVSQELMRNPAMVATLVNNDTGVWNLDFPWIVPRKGGGLQPFVDNLDTLNPINVDVNFIGFLLVPIR